jgi:putative aldouronate transport system substrate-binding protein
MPLAACSSSQATSNATQANSKVKLPTFTPFTGVKPDLPAGQDLLPGFFSYPEHPVNAFSSPPAAGRAR